eukprot:361377-Chlamydomonas_euryale.AAC.1
MSAAVLSSASFADNPPAPPPELPLPATESCDGGGRHVRAGVRVVWASDVSVSVEPFCFCALCQRCFRFCGTVATWRLSAIPGAVGSHAKAQDQERGPQLWRLAAGCVADRSQLDMGLTPAAVLVVADVVVCYLGSTFIQPTKGGAPTRRAYVAAAGCACKAAAGCACKAAAECACRAPLLTNSPP